MPRILADIGSRCYIKMAHPNRRFGDIEVKNSDAETETVITMNHHYYYYLSIFHAMEVSAKKNHDYAGGPDADPLANFKMSKQMGLDPSRGMWMRALDKVGRVNTFMREGELKVENEGLGDALMDLGNYCFLMLALLEDEKNETKTQYKHELGDESGGCVNG